MCSRRASPLNVQAKIHTAQASKVADAYSPSKEDPLAVRVVRAKAPQGARKVSDQNDVRLGDLAIDHGTKIVSQEGETESLRSLATASPLRLRDCKKPKQG